jgi:C-terminal processing protease CtpA/Prc
MRFFYLVLLCTSVVFSSAQESYTKEQIHRLADAGKLYGYVKYFHPYLQYKNINWDSAFVAAVPKILAAKNKTDYAVSLKNLFLVLNDPLTTASAKTFENVGTIEQSLSDSILYINMSHYNPLYNSFIKSDTSSKILSSLLNSAAKVKGVVFDLRPATETEPSSVSEMETLFLNGGIDKLYKGTFYGPSNRGLVYRTIFFKYFQQERVYSYWGKGDRDVPMVFLVNKGSVLPPIVVGLQANGKAAIVQEEGTGDISGAELRFYVADSVLIRLRKSELVRQDGVVGLPSSGTYKKSEFDSALAIAKKLIHSFTKDSSLPPRLQPPLFPVPLFRHYAAAYSQTGSYPSLGFRVLAAAEIFTIIDHFFAYKHLTDDNWEEVYSAVLPRFIEAKDSIEYLKAVAEFNYYINDSHGSIGRSDYTTLLNGGEYSSGVFGRVVEKQFVVDVITHDSVGRAAGIKRGDIILEINGVEPVNLIDAVRKYKAASNPASQTYLISESLLRGDEGEHLILKVKDATGKTKKIVLTTSKRFEVKEWGAKINHLLHQPMLRLITKDIGYVDLNKLQLGNIDSMFEKFKYTKAIIFDMRGYPNGVLWVLASRLTERKNVAGALFSTPVCTAANINAIGDYHDRETWVLEKQIIPDNNAWIYKGRTVMLMDESTLSQAEHTGLFLKAANGTKFIGSRTAGANGTAFAYPIPGSIWLGFTGHQSAYPNGKQMQRIGLVPDIEVHRTIKGIQAGKDDVLEKAIKYLRLSL